MYVVLMLTTSLRTTTMRCFTTMCRKMKWDDTSIGPSSMALCRERHPRVASSRYSWSDFVISFLVTPGSAIVIQLRDGQYRSTGVLMTWENGKILMEDEDGDRNFSEVLLKLLFVYCEMIAEDPDRYKNVHSDHGVDAVQ